MKLESSATQRVHFAEEDLLPLSALQHIVFCERQCALIHIEQVWKDNPLTLEGSHMHDRTHESAQRRELRGDILITRGLAIRSLRLGLSGIADVVEFHRLNIPEEMTDQKQSGISLDGMKGLWQPFPVEYKRGRPKLDHCDEVQLCAQAMCIEEMLGVAVPAGALFYGAIKRRYDVAFSSDLRVETEHSAVRLHELISSGITPRVEAQPKCKHCSLVELCQPDATAPKRSVKRYLVKAIANAIAERGGES